jgi:hypothetical protein
MYKIIIKGLAGHTNAVDKSILHGVSCEDDFSEYFGPVWHGGDGGVESLNEQCLIDKGVKGGHMSFKYDIGENKIYVLVSYTAKEKLDDWEMGILIDYTQGQMSDGIGEGFEQYPCTYKGDEEIYISPWYPGQILTGTQREIEVKKKSDDIDDKNIKWY